MKTCACVLLMVAFLSSVSYAQGQQKEQLTKSQRETQNKILDKAEATIRKKFGPAVVRITRDFSDPHLIIEIDEIAIAKIKETNKLQSPTLKTEAAEPGPFTKPTPSEQRYPSTWDRITGALRNSGAEPRRPQEPFPRQGSPNRPGTHIITVPIYPNPFGH